MGTHPLGALPDDTHRCDAPGASPPRRPLGIPRGVPPTPAPTGAPRPQPYFAKLMKRKWLTSSEPFDAIVMLITSFTQRLRPLRPEPYQVGAAPGAAAPAAGPGPAPAPAADAPAVP